MKKTKKSHKELEQENISQIVWSTKKVEEWHEAYLSGVKTKDTPYMDGIIGVRKPNLPFAYTDEEILELGLCANDPVYFAQKYCQILCGSKGYQPVKLFEYQKKMLRAYKKNRFNIVLSSRQMGKTVTAAIFLLWFAIFQTEKNVGLLSNKYVSAKEIADKIKEILERIPFFMKPGMIVYNSMEMKFDNNCRIICQATTPRSFIGFTLHVLYCDEFAHVENNTLSEFYENAMPTISSMDDSKIIITSTPNGFNKYYDLYTEAEAGLNSYVPLRVDWWERPGRDEAWHQKMVHDCGGEDSFQRQYGNSFLSSSSTLLSSETMAEMQQAQTVFVPKTIPELLDIRDDIETYLTFHPDFDINDLRDPNKRFIIAFDLAEGGGGDFTIMQIFRVNPFHSNSTNKRDHVQLEQIGVWQSNNITLEDFAKIPYQLSTKVMNPDNHKFVIEWNTYGPQLYLYLCKIHGYNNMFDSSVIMKFLHTNDAQYPKMGLKLNSVVKADLCQQAKKLMFLKNIIVSEVNTVKEFENFGRVKDSATYKATRGHDDLVMAIIDVSSVFNNKQFDIMVEEILSMEANREYEDEYIGIIDSTFGGADFDLYGEMNNSKYYSESEYDSYM